MYAEHYQTTYSNTAMAQDLLDIDNFMVLENCLPHEYLNMTFVVGSFCKDEDEPVVCALTNIYGNILKVTSDSIYFLPYDLNVCYNDLSFPFLTDDLTKIIQLVRYGERDVWRMIKKDDNIDVSESIYFLQINNMDLSLYCSYENDIFLEDIPVPLKGNGTIRECNNKAFMSAIGCDIYPDTVLSHIKEMGIRISNFDGETKEFKIFNSPIISFMLCEEEKGSSHKQISMSNFRRHDSWIDLMSCNNDMAECISYMKDCVRRYHSNEFIVPEKITSLICIPIATNDTVMNILNEIDEIAVNIMFSMMLALIEQYEEGDLVVGHGKTGGLLSVVMTITSKHLFSNTSMNCSSAVFRLLSVCFQVIQEILLCSSINETVSFDQIPVIQRRILKEFSNRWDNLMTEMSCQSADFFEVCESLKKYWNLYSTASQSHELKNLFRSSCAFPLTIGISLYQLINFVFKNFSYCFLRDHSKDFVQFYNNTKTVVKCLKECAEYPYKDINKMLEDTLSVSFSKLQQETGVVIGKYMESCLSTLHFICYCLLEVCKDFSLDISVISIDYSTQYLLDEVLSYLKSFVKRNEWKIDVSWFDEVDVLMKDITIGADALNDRKLIFLHKCCGNLGMPNFSSWYSTCFIHGNYCSRYSDEYC